ncbi:hypothetical protein CspeluHIS016_0109800 [Cutaneotrichosporon spelunceum]|uniref:Eukaryotic mitochondrial regulator protein-domain-containing protein n=1 Tax=Cutaneotrichosporon spelunceum TaxID=1672016 RepID=A0AAD3TPQ2_9TREE|nr:hypothetical protein CspeluHIS016_0109800 [Cutaneotrichosporon spelunceum]
MSFSTAVAGPSRLPHHHLRPLAAARRGYAAPARPRKRRDEENEVDPDGKPVGGVMDEIPPNQVPAIWRWFRSYGDQYRVQPAGQRAKWLGGNIPYPSNPSFRPPPPLSNDLMDVLSADLKLAGATVGQVAEKHNVSKARLEAVKKLKMVEAEFVRQGLPLQHAFHNRMEVLLGVQSPMKNKTVSLESRRSEEQARALHPSTKAEQDEEWIKEHSTSHGGAFGDLHKQAKYEGMVMEAWQFKDEAEVIADRKAAAAAAEPKPIPKWTPPVQPTNFAKPANTVYRFIDTTKEEKRKAGERKAARDRKQEAKFKRAG